MKNMFEVRGNIAVIFLDRKDGTTIETIIDLDDLAKAQEYSGNWFASWSKCTKSFYVYGSVLIEEGKWIVILLHRWIMDTPSNLQVDHRNHNTLDNTRNNLRNVSRSVNNQNQKGLNNHNTSGVRGVHWLKSSKKWQAYLTINGKQIHLGLFTDIQLAARAAHEARVKLMPGYVY